MRVYTTHFRAGADPILVREGFSWAGFLFGFFYLAIHRARVPAALTLAALILTQTLSSAIGNPAPLLGLAILQGLFAHDLLRWGLSRRGFAAGPVVAATDPDQALARLLVGRPDVLPPGLLPQAAGAL
jgi:hypothetical protein